MIFTYSPFHAFIPEDLENTLREYIDFFNQKRPHRKLKLQTPDQFEENYMAGLASNC